MGVEDTLLFSTGSQNTLKPLSSDVNLFEPQITDANYLFTRSNEEPSNTPEEVDAKLQTDYDFHGFDKEDKEEEDNEAKELDEDEELLYGDLKGTNETMGESIPTNHTTASKPKLVNVSRHADNLESTTAENSAHVEKSNSLGSLHSSDNHPNTTWNPKVLSSTSKNVDKNLGNFNKGISDNSIVLGGFGETPKEKDSTTNILSENIKQNNQAGYENSVEQSAGDKFRNPEQPSSVNSMAVYGNNRQQATATNQNPGSNLSQQKTYNEHHVAPVYRNSGQSQSSQPEKEATNDNANNQDSNLKTTKGENNGELEKPNVESGLENSNQDNNMTPGNAKGMANSETEQTQIKPLSKDGNFDANTNNQNGPGAQNEKDDSQISQGTQEQNNVKVRQETSADGNGDDRNGNPDPDANHENLDSQVHPENPLSENANEDQHEPTDSQNTNDGNTPQTSSNSLEPSVDSPIAITGKPEFITAEQDEAQSENTHAWGGDSIEENGGIPQRGDQGKRIKWFVFIIPGCYLAHTLSVRRTLPK